MVLDGSNRRSVLPPDVTIARNLAAMALKSTGRVVHHSLLGLPPSRQGKLPDWRTTLDDLRC
ncbi:MAG: hypothetical protein ACR2KG_00550 [Nocardioidaceae bacterium]